MSLVKVVVDTNILVSACLGSKNASGLIEAYDQGRFELAASPELIAEFREVLTRPIFASKPGVTELALRIAKRLESLADIVEPSERRADCRDPKDNFVLEVALAARVDAIVTGDKDLLDLHPFEGIEVLSLVEFLERVGR